MNESIADTGNLGRGTRLGASVLRRWTRRLVRRQLEGMRWGHLRWVESGEVTTFGTGASAAGEEPIAAEIRVEDERFYSKVAFGGSVGAAEAYMAGFWSTPDLTAVLRLILRHRDLLDGMETGWARLGAPLRWALQKLRANTRSGSRRNIYAHYDLGNEFFALFLDRQMMYSCALFDPPGIDLDQASEVKLERICRKLRLEPGDRVLEIGTGWGGFALYAARRYGCHVTTTTISPAQFQHAREQVRAAGLEDRVEVLARDYRDLEGTYDKLVSIEMIEAVGLGNLDTFFRVCSERLRPDGLMVLQAITIADRYYERARRSVDFIQRYIFPGSGLPSVGAMSRSVAHATDLRIVHLEDFGAHYAETLRAWRSRFAERSAEVRAQGFDQVFERMWEYYFCYCEAGFDERSISDVHLVLAKPGDRRPHLLGELA